MPIQTATTGNLDKAQRVVIAQTRFTMEHNQPCVNLVEHLNLGQGEKQMTVPKVGQMSAHDLQDGIPVPGAEDIGMTTRDLTTAEVGLRVILTDKLVRQENESVFRIVGRQMGDAMARKKDTDVIALFAALNGGTTLGADNLAMTLTRLAGCIATAKANKVTNPVAVHHPNAVFAVTTSLAITPSATYPMPTGLSEELLRNFYAMRFNQTPVFEDGNIAKIAGVDSGYGAIFDRGAMAVLDQMGFKTERDRDIDLRATKVVVTADYGCWELDDGMGWPLRFEIGDPDTTV